MFLHAKRPFELSLLLLLAIVIGAALWLLPELDEALVHDAVARIGPVAIVLLVALGIVVSPIPSGVIALVAGALYGPLFGGALTVAGAVLGAASAFLLSRCLGRGLLIEAQSATARFLTRDRSQQGLMLAVFASRLIPFISFDAVSYVAGLTPLALWRFLLATMLGTAPVCFAFAYAGARAANTSNPLLLALACGVTLLVPALILLARLWRNSEGRSTKA